MAKPLREGYTLALFQDSEATASRIRTRFRDLAKLVDKGQGTFIFYFSGHGFQSGKENYPATYGTTEANLTSQGLPLSEVITMLFDTGARRRIAFVDACRNDPDAKSVGSMRSFGDLRESEGMRILYSTAPGSVSFEDESLQHGVFSYFLMEGLKGKAANSSDGLITFDDLDAYVSREMRNYGIALAVNEFVTQDPFLGNAPPANRRSSIAVGMVPRFIVSPTMAAALAGGAVGPEAQSCIATRMSPLRGAPARRERRYGPADDDAHRIGQIAVAQLLFDIEQRRREPQRSHWLPGVSGGMAWWNFGGVVFRQSLAPFILVRTLLFYQLLPFSPSPRASRRGTSVERSVSKMVIAVISSLNYTSSEGSPVRRVVLGSVFTRSSACRDLRQRGYEGRRPNSPDSRPPSYSRNETEGQNQRRLREGV